MKIKEYNFLFRNFSRKKDPTSKPRMWHKFNWQAAVIILPGLLLFLIVLAGNSMAQSKKAKVDIAKNPVGSVSQNEFVKQCSSCHGEHAQGDGPWHTRFKPEPANLTLVNDSEEMMFSIVINGIPNTMMPPHPEMSRGQFTGIYEYIHSQPKDMTNQWDHAWWLKGDTLKESEGRSYFINSCAGCHGPEGNGDGPWAANSNVWPKPANFHARNSDIGRLYFIITDGRPGTMMPPQKGKLSELARWQLAKYVSSLIDPNSKATLQVNQTPITTVANPYFSADQQAARDGEASYTLNCAPCHGDKGKGNQLMSQVQGREWYFGSADVEYTTTGEERYNLWCAPCHGSKGKGSFLAPRLIDREWYFGGGTDQAVFTVVSEGVPGKLMPAWKQLSDDERWKIITYVRSLGGLPDPFGMEEQQEMKKIHSIRQEEKK